MSDQSPVLPLFIHTYSARFSPAMNARAATLGMSATLTWPIANTAFYYPMFIPFNYPVRRVLWTAGGSGTAMNVDFGIYTESGTKVYSTGSTALVSANAVQYVTPTEFILTPGAYYFAFACSSISSSRLGSGTTGLALPHLALTGVLQQATALPLPATMTPVAVANSAYVFCGVTRTSTGF